MKYSTKEIIIFALTVALIIVIGYLFYLLGSLFPMPGYKFIVFAPFLGFMFYIPIYKVRKIGSIFTASTLFAIIMSFLNIFMGLAIFLSGLSADLLTLILFRNFDSQKKMILSAGFYSLAAVFWSFTVMYFLLQNPLYRPPGGWFLVLMILLFVYLMGVTGAYLAHKFIIDRFNE